MVHSPDGFEQTPSKAKDEMSHLGVILLGGLRLTWTGHMVSANRCNTQDKKMKRGKKKLCNLL